MHQTETTLDELAGWLAGRPVGARHVTALAGPPGAGKSTAAEALAAALNAEAPGSAAVLPMDGYHYDDMVLNARGWRPRKGAPHTFDVAGFARMLARLRANDEPEVAVPVFDREIEIARNAARIIPQSVRHLIVEGNYLLLAQPPWEGLRGLFDTAVFLDVPLAELERRLAARWRALDPGERRRRIERNDLPNARLVLSERLPADFVLRPGVRGPRATGRR